MSENKSVEPLNAIWCLIANVADEQWFGESHEIRHGTKHFSANTKLYCYPSLWGDGYEQIKVIGRHRGSPKLVTMVLPYKRITNWRVMLVYKPAIIQAIGTRWGEKEHIERWLPWLQHREKVERTRILGFETVDPDSALLYAAELGKIDEVRNALARGANIDVLGYNGLTPLMVAVNYSRLEAARILVESGADKTATSPTGTTILSIIHDKVIGGSERKATMLRLLGYTKEADEITNQYRVHNSSSRPYKPE